MNYTKMNKRNYIPTILLTTPILIKQLYKISQDRQECPEPP